VRIDNDDEIFLANIKRELRLDGQDRVRCSNRRGFLLGLVCGWGIYGGFGIEEQRLGEL
jgi:hypothetical protein